MLPIVSMPPSRMPGPSGSGVPTTFWQEGSVPTCGMKGDSGSGGAGSVCKGSPGGLPEPGGSGFYGPTKKTCCLGPDVLVSLVSGEQKRAEDIEIGDQLRGPDGAPQLVDRLIRGSEMRYFLRTTAGSFICSEAHRVQLSNGEFRAVMDLNLCEDNLMGTEGDAVEIIERLPMEEGPVFCWNCEPEHVFECAGIMHHNAKIDTVIAW